MTKKRQLKAREQSSDYRPEDKMPTHDIIDNREEILLEHIKNLLRNSVKQIDGENKKAGMEKEIIG
jgi:hypothetical protein